MPPLPFQAQKGVTASDTTLALNRYICGSVLPLLTKYAHFLGVKEVTAGLLEATLHTAYRLAMCRSITNNQRDVVSDFLVALIEHIQPYSMVSLIRKIATNMRCLTREVRPPMSINTFVFMNILKRDHPRPG